MRDTNKKKSTLAIARNWATKRGLFGAQAFLKYVILSFAENLNRVSDEVVFKGGNLLWVYIGTPRATTDLDLATLNINSHKLAKELIQKACSVESDIQFSVQSFKEISLHDKLGAALTIKYKTEQGATNSFEVDMVYALSTDCHHISSPVNSNVKIRSATIENIVADKVAACRRFESGNTRMKDFDDLWRISRSSIPCDPKRLTELFDSRG
ncbi:hypothetical protein EBU99_13480, partial [bacterium]|nr:hypothetical protein [bacterium]